MLYVRFPLSLRNVEDLLHDVAWMLAMNPLGIGGTGLALSLQARSKSEAQGGCNRATGSGTWMKSL